MSVARLSIRKPRRLACGLLTAFFPRPQEYGPHQKRDYAADQDWDIVATDIQDVAAKLGV